MKHLQDWIETKIQISPLPPYYKEHKKSFIFINEGKRLSCPSMCSGMWIKCHFRVGKAEGGRDHGDEKHSAEPEVQLEWEVSPVFQKLIKHTWASTKQKMLLPAREPCPLSQQQFCGSSDVCVPILKGCLGSTLLRDFKVHTETMYIIVHIEQCCACVFKSVFGRASQS